TGASNHRHAFAGSLDANPNGAFVLLVRECGAFASSSHRHEAMGALVELPLNQPLISRLVESAVLEWGNQRREGSLEHLICPSSSDRPHRTQATTLVFGEAFFLECNTCPWYRDSHQSLVPPLLS